MERPLKRYKTGSPALPIDIDHIQIVEIPSLMYDVVNDLIQENIDENGRAYIEQYKIVDEYKKRAKVKAENFNFKWLDFEEDYRKTGWKVTYDGPAYCETFNAYYVFKKKLTK